MIDIKPGDAVIYVGGPQIAPELSKLVIGRGYRISQIIDGCYKGKREGLACRIPGHEYANPLGIWLYAVRPYPHWRFRKIEKADDEFCEQMSSLQPKELIDG